MRMFVISLLTAMGFASDAWAADNVMQNYFGNTAIATGGIADTHSVYSPDNTFVMTVPAFGAQFKGTWKVDGSTLCRTYDTPPPGVANPLCTPVEAHKIGDSWTVTANGRMRTVTLVKGIQ